MPRAARFLVFAALSGAIMIGSASPDEHSLARRWLFVMRNMGQQENVEKTIALLPRAQAAGYNAVALSDSRLYELADDDETYRANLLRIQQEASRRGLELIPCVMPIGYSGALLGADPNLAEGLPVKDALFVVSGGVARLLPDPPVSLPGGDFEQLEGGRLLGWDWYDNPEESTLPDHQVVRTGRTSVRMERIDEVEPRYGHCRFMRAVKVSPFRQYHISAWVKTDDFEAPESIRIAVLAPTDKERSLSFAEFGIQPTQDWTQYHLVFNSLQYHEARIYLGTWGGKAGRLWWDDVRLEEIGLVNVLRRSGCPLEVRGESGVVYREGQDFEPIRDPHLRVWEAYHEPPTIQLTPQSRIQEGQRLRVSYYHPIIIGQWQIMCCLSEPSIYDIMRRQVEAVNDLLHPSTFFMQHDEIRVANWDHACQSRGLTPGEMLADNARRCLAIIHDINPGAKVWVWSDMFDPMHNAVDEYYLVNGTWAGSWEGLPPEIGIVNWAGHLKGANLKWFADRGHQQILAGYYDGDRDGAAIRDWLKAGDGLPGIVGAVYTTWQDNYDHMEAWARAAWPAARAPTPE